MATNLNLPDPGVSGEETEAMLRAGNNCQRRRKEDEAANPVEKGGSISVDSTNDAKEPSTKSTGKNPTDTISINICTSANCTKVADPRMILCHTCSRYTHFECTEIPGYQLAQLMTKGYRKYVCAQCFGNVDNIYTHPSPKTDKINSNDEPIYAVPYR